MVRLDDYLNQWQRIAELVSRQMSSAVNFRESLQESIAPILATQETLQAIFESVNANQQVWQQAAAAAAAQQQAFQQAFTLAVSQQQRYSEWLGALKFPDFSQLARQATELQESLTRLLNPAFEELRRSFRELPPKTQEALLVLGSHGWFMDSEMTFPFLWQLKKALSEGNVREAEEALISHFENRLDAIEKSLVDKFPHRARLLKAAFRAHRTEEYELSIPVLLAQTDGICKETVCQYLFIRRDKKPSTAIYVEQIAADAFKAALLSPLAQILPINASECERSDKFDALNRHTVVHGDSLNYGTKVNSLKVISLINYVSDVLNEGPENP